MLWNPWDQLKESAIIELYKICLAIDTVVYNAITWIYSVFTTLATARLFDNEVIASFYNRIYMIISIVMLFIIAYSFLQIIINPDNLTKGNITPIKIVTNIILSLICILIIPTVFNYAYAVQNVALKENIIGKVILGVSSQNDDQVSGNLAVDIFETQFYPKNEVDCDQVGYDFSQISSSGNDYCQADFSARAESDIGYFSHVLADVSDGTIQYNYVMCFIVGVFVLYVLVVYVFDIALRAVKLAFYQLIAPIPSLLLIVPGQDKVFKTWLKEVIKTFLEVFLKSAILLFGVYLISLIRKNFNINNIGGLENVSGSVLRFSKLFIYLGIIMFIKQAPKLLGDVFGINLDSGGLSLKKRLQDSGIAGFADKVAGTIGGAYASYRSNRKGAEERLKDDDDFKQLNDKQKRNRLHKEGMKGVPLGALFGARGGMKGIGVAYNAGLDTQNFKANHLSRKDMLFNYMRGSLGIESLYEEQIELDKIRTDAQNYRDSRQIQRDEETVGMVKRQKDAKYDALIDANKTYEESVKATADYVKDETSKAKSDITRSVVVPRFVKYDDANSELTVQDKNSANYGKNAHTLAAESKNIDAQIIEKRQQINQLEQQIKEASASGGLRSYPAQLQAQVDKLNGEISTLGSNKLTIESDIKGLSAIGGSIKYDLVSGLNRSQIESIRDNLIQSLTDQGATTQQANDAFYSVMLGKDSSGNDFDFSRFGTRKEDNGTADFYKDIKSTDVFSMKDAISSIEKKFFDDGVNGSEQDIKLRELLSKQEAASQNSNVGKITNKDTAGVSVKFTVEDNTRSDATAFYDHYKKQVENTTSELQSNKTIDFNSTDLNSDEYKAMGIVDYLVRDDGTEVVRDSARTMNEIMAEMKMLTPQSEARLKAHETFSKQRIGLKQASEAVVKRREAFKATKNKKH